jgi:hypothetical protein
VQRALARQGLVLASRNDGDGALKLLAQEAICRRIGNKKRLAETLLLQATLNSKYPHDLAAATKFAAEHEQICRELGAQPELATGFQVQADLLAQQGNRAKLFTRSIHGLATRRAYCPRSSCPHPRACRLAMRCCSSCRSC